MEQNKVDKILFFCQFDELEYTDDPRSIRLRQKWLQGRDLFFSLPKKDQLSYANIFPALRELVDD